MEPCELMRQIRVARPGEQRTKDLEALVAVVKSGEVRDATFTPELYTELFGLLSTALTWRAKDVQADVCLAEQAFIGITRVPEFELAAAQAHVEEQLLRAIMARADGTARQEEWHHIRDLLLWAYWCCPSCRPSLRGLVGRALRASGSFTHKSAPVAALLEVLMPIIRGFRTPLTQVHRALLFEVLMPLHKPNDWLQWDRQTPMIAMYHKELVHCVLLFLDKQPSLSVRCLEMLCAYFPQSREANTPKEVLLIYEVSQILRYVDGAAFAQVLPLLLRHMVRLLSTHNAQPIQSVLQFWRDDHIAELFHAHADQVIAPLLQPLLRGGEPFWNPTVNRMTSLVLEKLEASNPELFREAAEMLWGPGRQIPAFVLAKQMEALAKKQAGADAAAEEAAVAKGPSPDVSSLKFCLGGWKPPSAAGGTGGKPPLTATGVAPWAMGAGGGGAAAMGGKQPPLTATGVAPWAFNAGPPRAGPLSGNHHHAAGAGPGAAPPTAGAGHPGPARGSLGALRPCKEDEVDDTEPERSGIELVHAYLKLLCPDGSSVAEGAQPWEAALMAETPTLLPNLKFHQLVFGASDLASGAFSVVRYARTIIKDKTQSQWPEYAVKVINTKTIQEHGYEASVNREICVLKMLSHPGIARMVSAFRWRDGAYLVLEYAARGDLHSILVREGKLPEDTVRFFLGETIAALCAIHGAGFVYGDLKPENIVITSNCHAKLTDFGGCRPVTPEARRRTQQSLLKRLRDGDWRAQDVPPEQEDVVTEADVEAVVDDGRVEGTTLYLPPEVVHGAAPTIAADAWALGCLEYQLLTGRPPMWVDSEREEDLRHRIVSFRFDEVLEPLPESARGLTRALLEADLERRLSVEGAAADPFFEGMNVFTLYTTPRGPEVAAAQRTAKPGEDDARWQKRQFSKIWTVMPSPEDYQLPVSTCAAAAAGAVLGPSSTVAETDAEGSAPFCEEVDAPGGVPRIESL